MGFEEFRLPHENSGLLPAVPVPLVNFGAIDTQPLGDLSNLILGPVGVLEILCFEKSLLSLFEPMTSGFCSPCYLACH